MDERIGEEVGRRERDEDGKEERRMEVVVVTIDRVDDLCMGVRVLVELVGIRRVGIGRRERVHLEDDDGIDDRRDCIRRGIFGVGRL